MEVHHPHHIPHKKKWSEYLLEFFMLFLAVFLGFIAENIRENSVERHREHQYLQSLVSDLKEDTTVLRYQLEQHKNSIVMMDSFITILNNLSLVRNEGNDLYYFGRIAPRLRTFTANMTTYEQLKNSGSFRLISDAEISEKIINYYQAVLHMRQLEDIYASEFVDYKRIAAQVFEPSVFQKQESGEDDVARFTDNPQLQNTDPKLLKQLCIYAIYMNGSRRTIVRYNERLLKAASDLINCLQKEYHLNNS
jgi:hypothetical protein